MKSNFSYQSDFFIPFVAFSIATHLTPLGMSYFSPKPPQVSVIQAPNSIDIQIIEESIVEEVIEEQIEDAVVKKEEVAEEVFTVEESQVETPLSTPEPTKETLTKKEPELDPLESTESLGAKTEAKPLKYTNPAPVYPYLARQRGWEGTVILRVEVDKEGVVNGVAIEESSGYKLLDKSARKTVLKWKFEPAKTGKITYASSVTIPIKFELKNK